MRGVERIACRARRHLHRHQSEPQEHRRRGMLRRVRQEWRWLRAYLRVTWLLALPDWRRHETGAPDGQA